MKVHLIIILLSSVSLQLNAQRAVGINVLLYEHVLKTPTSSDIGEITEHFEKISENDEDLMEMAYYWICNNIEYDIDLSRNAQRSYEDISVAQTIKNGKTICSGYSKLLCEFAYYLGVECELINGIGQNYLDQKVDSSETNHSWNAVLISEDWRLIDVTWGAGVFKYGTDQFIQQIDMRYFLSDPEFLLIDHYPEDSIWQLRDDPISYSEFSNDYWTEMRFRKFNNLMYDEDYQNYLKLAENVKP